MGNKSNPSPSPRRPPFSPRAIVGLGALVAVAAGAVVGTASGEGSHLLVVLLLAAVLLGGGVPLLVAGRRQACLRQAVEQADLALLEALTRHHAFSSTLAGGDPLHRLLEAASDEDLLALGDAALASPRPFAAEIFGTVYRILLRRRRQRRRDALRRDAWRSLRDGIARDGKTEI